MTSIPTMSDQVLRLRAEEMIKTNEGATPDKLSLEEKRLFHELQVHQIELEMQNEELHKAKAELENLYARYLDLYDFAPLSYVTINDRGVILEANLTASILLGIDRGLLIKQSIRRFILDENQDLFDLHCKQLVETGQPQVYELQMVKSDGTLFWVHLTSTIMQNPSMCSGHVGNVAAIFRIGLLDITLHKQADKEHQEIERRLRTVVQTTMDGYWLMDMDGHLLEVNDTYCRISGYSKQELLDMRTPDLEVSESADEIASRIRTIQEKGKHKFEARYRNKDGSVLDVEVSAQYLPIDGGRIVAFLSNISERKVAEKELIKKNAEIEQFLYTVSHDLRSPLVTVKTFMGYLVKDMSEGKQDDLAQDVIFINSAADKMRMLLDELVELSRIGRIETPSIKVSLREVLAETLLSLAAGIRERQVDIRLPDTDLILFGDRQRLCQIWQNLIENALKYGQDGCIPNIELGTQQSSGETIFFVKDNGIGIDPLYLKKVFGIFEKMNPNSPGAGMGLSMIQRIVEKCGGRVWAESEGIGKGSCFFFTLPQMMVQD